MDSNRQNDVEVKMKEIWSKVLKLSLDKFGMEDDFFSVGGDSITSIIISSKISEELKLSASVRNIFEYSTIRELATFLLEAQQLEPPPPTKELEKIQLKVPETTAFAELEPEFEAIYFANSLQEGFVHIYLKSENKDDGFMKQSEWEYNKEINTEILQDAWFKVAQHYPGLRTSFAWEKGRVLQKIHRIPKIEFNVIKCINEETFDRAIEENKQQDFDLFQLPLFRVHLFQVQNSISSKCILSCHHAILDRWSLGLLLETVHIYYHKIILGESLPLGTDEAYLETQKYLTHMDNQIANKYWDEYLSDLEETVQIPDLLHPDLECQGPVNLMEHRGSPFPKEKSILIDGKTFYQFKESCKTNHITMNAAILWVWHKTLHTFGRGKESLVGVVFSTREVPITGIDKSVGLYINTLPVYVNHESGDKNLISFSILQLQETIAQHSKYSGFPLSKLRKSGREFDTLFAFNNNPANQNEHLAKMLGITFKNEGTNGKEKDIQADYPIFVYVFVANDVLSINITYAENLFPNFMIQSLLDVMKILIEQLAENMNRPVSVLKFMENSEEQKVLMEWNKTFVPIPENITVLNLIKEQLDRNPEEIAIIYEERKWTYKEMFIQAEILGNYLYNAGCSGQCVTLFLDRSEFSIVAILGVWLGEGYYAPIDTSTPRYRVRKMIKTVNAKFILADLHHHEYLKSILNEEDVAIFCPGQIVTDFFNQALSRELKFDRLIGSPNGLAYIVFTSGTTGEPKACLQHHKGLLNFFLHYRQFPYFEPNQTIPLLLNYVFDAYLEPLFHGLCNGNTLLLLPTYFISNPELMYKTMNDYKVKYIDWTPSHAACLDMTQLRGLKVTTIGGEPLKPNLAKRMLSSIPGFIIRNEYGPSETTIISHAKIVTDPKHITLGKPISNVTTYLLNQHMVPVPVGAPGEIHIGGIGVGKGYAGQPQLTAQRFVKNPFQTQEEKLHGRNEILYKTGDLGKYREDGDIVLFGRNDTQVKVRGQRIELLEIQSVLDNFPGITESIVTLWQNELLVGYYISEEELDEDKLIDFLRSKLIEAMVPKYFVRIYTIPLTMTGKLNLKALPEPTLNFRRKDIILPQNPLEKSLCSIWSEVLKLPIDSIGVEDNFFRLGVDSVLSIFVIGKIRENILSAELLSVKDLYENPTIRVLANKIELIQRERTNCNVLQ